jgi:general secretion pathway protein G
VSPSFYLQRGMTWIEFGVVAIVLGVVAIVLAQRLTEYQELAERADMEYGAMMFKSALRIRVSVLMTEDRMREADKLLCENPVRWLDRRPPNYAGEAHGVAVAEVLPGHWYFDPVECSMGYMSRHGAHLAPDGQGLRRVRYHVSMTAVDAAGHASGLSFVPVAPYRWQVQ